SGEVYSYGEVAKAIGEPKAVRAVASACARNHIGVLIPCHRVIRGNGELGGYRGGLAPQRTRLAGGGEEGTAKRMQSRASRDPEQDWDIHKEHRDHKDRTNDRVRAGSFSSGLLGPRLRRDDVTSVTSVRAPCTPRCRTADSSLARVGRGRRPSLAIR